MHAASGARPPWVVTRPRTGRLLDTANMSCFLETTKTKCAPVICQRCDYPSVKLCANASVDGSCCLQHLMCDFAHVAFQPRNPPIRHFGLLGGDQAVISASVGHL